MSLDDKLKNYAKYQLDYERSFDQRYLRVRPPLRDQTGGHPSGGAAAEDDDRLACRRLRHDRSTSPEKGGSALGLSEREYQEGKDSRNMSQKLMLKITKSSLVLRLI